MLIDTHAHLNFNAYKTDINKVIRRSLDNQIWIINPGSQYDTSKKAVEIAQKYEKGVYAAIGLHPIHLPSSVKPSEVRDETEFQRTDTGLVKIKLDSEEIQFNSKEEIFSYEKYKELGKNEKVVAIGEIGFDYYYKPKTKRKLELFKEKQRTVLCKQLGLAKELNLPVIFHCRMAHQDLIEVLKNEILNSKLRGVIHCFTGNWEQAKRYLEMEFYLGFNGLILKMDFDEIIKKTPLKKILIETDCPYLSPPPFEGRRNEPFYLKYVAEKIAQIKNISYEEVAEITTQNAKKLFKLL